MSGNRVGVRATAVAMALLGLLVGIAVIAYFNFGSVLAAMGPIGLGGFLAVVAAQVGLFLPLGLAWWVVALQEAALIPAFIWGRLMREAASDVLPFSHVGAILIATRAAVLGGVSTATASGSCVIDITFEIVAQLIYTLVGVALLAHQLGFGAGSHGPLMPVLVGLGLATCAVGGFIATQRRGLRAFERLVRRWRPSVLHHAEAITAVVEQAYEQPLRLLACLGLHLFSWFSAAGGAWLILDLMGHPLPFLSVVGIESLLFATRNAAFMVPSGLGVQEGAYALLGPLFGLPADAALALSLLKRARDLAIGIPLLLGWQIIESRRTLRGGVAR